MHQRVGSRRQRRSPSSARGTSAGGAGGDATGDASASATSDREDPTTNACVGSSPSRNPAGHRDRGQPGVPQNSDNQSDCEWASTQCDTPSVGLTVSPYDDSLWQTVSSATSSTPVAGIGDAAFKGWPPPRLDDQGEGLPGRPGDHRLPGNQGCDRRRRPGDGKARADRGSDRGRRASCRSSSPACRPPGLGREVLALRR